MEKFIDEFAKIPGPQKALGTFAAALLIVAGGYFMLVSDTMDEIAAKDEIIATKNTEKNTLADQARNLEENKRKVQRLKARLKKAQDQLPTKAEVPKLLRDIDFEATQSGLHIQKFDVQQEKVRKGRADIPIKMKVKGSFHELGVFFDRVAKMDRIVNVANVEVKGAKFENKKIVLTSSFTATTYRFVESKKKKKK